MVQHRISASEEMVDGANLQSWDVNFEWAEMRARAGLPPHAEFWEVGRPVFEASLAPIVLLYTGFFMGPLVTAFGALLCLVHKPSLRQFLVLCSAGALAWLLIQGISFLIGTSLSPNSLQVMRSSLNLAMGIFCLLFVRHITPGKIVITRQSVAQSVGALAVLLSIYTGLSSNFLVWMGR